MYISKLSIRNYRNFRNSCVPFNKGINTIIGENGSGKTNLFQALRIMVDETMPRVIKLTESDFNRSIGSWQGHWIIIQVQFSDLDSSDEAQSIAMHKVGNADEVDSNTGTYSYYFRPNIAIRRSLYELSEDPHKSYDLLDATLRDITLNEYESIFMGKGNVDFSEDENYKKYIGDFDSMIFPNPEELQSDVYGIRISSGSITNEFACTFAKALRDVESDLRSYKDNPLINLLRDKEKSIAIEKKGDIETKVKELNSTISELDEVKAVSKGISDSIKGAVGETYAPNVNIKSELPAEMERLMQSLKLWVGDSDEDGYEGRLWELSLGGANLIYLSLKLLEYEKVKKLDKIANFILIEEPEAHIHTHIQKTLFQKFESKNTQIFITTHSTHISSVSQIGSMCILGKCKQKTEIYNPSNNLNPIEQTHLERYLDASRTNLLFAKGVILVEGDAEQILIPVMFKKVFGVSLDEIGISLINIGSTGFTNIAQLFHEDRVRKNCSIITDNDLSIEPLPSDYETDTEYQKKCRNSQKSGQERKLRLDEFSDDNEYVNVYYAKHTFEVDFLIKNNMCEIEQTVEKLYQQPADIARIKGLINNSDIAISGKEALRLANTFKKGWYAIHVSENITNLTGIPNYILQAITFANPYISDNILRSIGQYRLKAYSKRTFKDDKKDYVTILDQFNKFESNLDALKHYISILPKDILTKMIDYYHVEGIK
jgi:predicted ATP-dependent endonuclease of OLD family